MSLNISDFSWFFCKNCNPPGKSYPLFSSNPPLKVEVLSSPPFENLVGGPTPLSPEEGRGGCILCSGEYSNNHCNILNHVKQPQKLFFPSSIKRLIIQQYISVTTRLLKRMFRGIYGYIIMNLWSIISFSAIFLTLIEQLSLMMHTPLIAIFKYWLYLIINHIPL